MNNDIPALARASIHRIVAIRLLIACAVLSVVLGGAVLYLQLREADTLVHRLAVAEARTFIEHMEYTNPAHRKILRHRAEEFLFTSGFINVKIYDAAEAKLVDVVKPGMAARAAGFPEQVHNLARGSESHHHTFWSGGRPLVQLLLPLDQGRTRVGYFEGLYEVDTATAKSITSDLAKVLALALTVVVITTIALYPVIVSLNAGLARLSSALMHSNLELMEVLGSAVAARDSGTYVHNYRVTIYAVRLAEALGLTPEDIRRLIAGAFLHDVGKIGVSDSILLKPEGLSDKEASAMHAHVLLGVEIISRASWLESARDVVEFHHEKFDGSGYARGLAGEAIPLNARIFAVVDVFDALTSVRPYKKALPFKDAMARVCAGRGSHFDPRIVDAFAHIGRRLFDEIHGTSEAGMHARLRQLVETYYVSHMAPKP